MSDQETNPVALLIMLVFYNENHVKTRQDGRLKVDVLTRRVVRPRGLQTIERTYLPGASPFVVSTPNRVRRREHAGSGVEYGRNTCLGD